MPEPCLILQSVPVEIVYLLCDQLSTYKDFFHFRITCTTMYDTLASYHDSAWKKTLAATRVQRCWRRNRHYHFEQNESGFSFWLRRQEELGLAPDRVVMRRLWLLRNTPLMVNTTTALQLGGGILKFEVARFFDFMLDFSVESSTPDKMDYRAIEEVTFVVGGSTLCKWSGKNARRKNYVMPWPFPGFSAPYHYLDIYVKLNSRIESTPKLHIRGCFHNDLRRVLCEQPTYIPYIPSLYPAVQLYAANEAGIDVSCKAHMVMFQNGLCVPSLELPYRFEGVKHGGFLNCRKINFVSLAELSDSDASFHLRT